MKQLLNTTKPRIVEAAGTSAGTELLSDAIDMAAGYEGVLFLSNIATANAGNFMKLQQSDDDGSSDAYSDIEGSKATAAGNDDQVAIDIYKPAKRYVRASMIRAGANTVTGPIWAIPYGPRVQPVDNTDSDMVGVLLVTPDEGTA